MSDELVVSSTSWRAELCDAEQNGKRVKRLAELTPPLTPPAAKVDRLLLKMPVRLGPMGKRLAEGANIRRLSRSAFCQRVEDNAFHLFAHGLGCGVGRSLGAGGSRGVGVGRGVEVGVGVGLTVGVGVGLTVGEAVGDGVGVTVGVASDMKGTRT